MFLGRTVVHGIYVLCYLSRQREGCSATSATVAEAVGVPPEHARKILTALATAGLVSSSRGRTGGFALARELTATSMLDVLDALQPDAGSYALQPRQCPMSDEATCGVRSGLAVIRDEVRALYARTTLASVLGDDCRSGWVIAASAEATGGRPRRRG